MDEFMAIIKIFAGNFAPRSFMFCNGQLLSIAQNTALFSLLGTTYGGNGTTTFGLPDLRGRTPIGPGQGPGLPTYNLGELAGTPTTTLNITHLPSHNHTAVLSNGISTPNAANAIGDASTPENNYLALSPKIGSGPNATQLKTYATPTAATNNIKSMAPGQASGTPTIGISGNNSAFSNMQPYLAINYIICSEGVYPSRN